MDTRKLVQVAVKMLCDMEPGKRVVLYVDQAMTDESGGFVPVMCVEGDQGVGARFPADWHGQIAAVFGRDYAAACALVDELNAENGIGARDARDIALATIFSGHGSGIGG